MTLQTFDCLNLTDIILNNDADTIMDAIRIAASECHGAISLLTKRSKTDVDGLVRFSTDTGRMLIAVGLLRDKLHSTDQWIDKTYKKNSQVKRYIKLNQQISECEVSKNFSGEKRQRRELTILVKMAQGIIKRLHIEIRASYLFRLDMLRYWQWFISQNADLYQLLIDLIVANLRILREALPDNDELRFHIESTVNNHTPCAIHTPEPIAELPDELLELRRRIISEIDQLNNMRSDLEKIRETSRELESTEALLKVEINNYSTTISEITSTTTLITDTLIQSHRNQTRMAFHDKSR